jgi:glycosyltransferase involved in cell wall biosynthesis
MLKENNMSDLVSIIVPVYNVERYLEECIASLLAQSYQAIEIILIDDGSTDSSHQIAERAAKLHKNVFLFTEENNGQSTARNLGITNSHGQYILFVDSDDFVTPSHVEELYHAIRSTNSKVAMCKFTKNKAELQTSQNQEYSVITGTFLELVTELYKSSYPAVAPVAKLYHRSLFYTVRFHEHIIYEDGILFYEIIDQIDQMALVTSPSYYYRTTENSTLTSKISKKNFDVFKKNDITKKFFEREHPEAMAHFYQKALNLNDSVATKCFQDKGVLSKQLFNALLEQNKEFSRRFFPRKLLYTSKLIYVPFIFFMSKIYAQKITDKQTILKKGIGKLVK